MTFPVYIPFGSSPILLHVATEFLAFFAGFRYFTWLLKKNPDPISPRSRTWVVIASIFGALIGSRVLGGLEDPARMLHSTDRLLYFYQNKTVLGGLLGGLWAVEFVKKIIGEKRSSGDMMVYPILLALIIGRAGCFSMGVHEETYGLPTRLVTGMDLGDGLVRHPVALYEIAFLLLFWLTINQVEKRVSLRNGIRFKAFLITYCLFRFFLDFIKPHFTWNVGLSSIQIACLAGLAYYLYIGLIRRRSTPSEAT